MKTFASYKPKIEIVSDSEDLAQRTLELFIDYAQKAIEAKGIFYSAISGGSTPKSFFNLLGESPQAKDLAWEKIHLFWVDERYVSPDSPQSNYKLAVDTFLSRIDIPEKNVHRIPTESSDFKASARMYEETIRNVFKMHKKKIPQFDLIVLGMGKDGHTGSLLPDTYAAFDKDDLACVVYVLDEKLNRITLTAPVLCAASHLLMLVSGQDKSDILKDVLTSEPDDVRYPVHVLWPVLNKVTWLIDKEAAQLL